MTVAFTCPYCETKIYVADECAGQTRSCATCGSQVRAPSVRPGPGRSSLFLLGIFSAIAAVGLLSCGGLLAALLIPAFEAGRAAAREAAERIQCSNQLQQIGLALHQYHQEYRSFPPAYTVDVEGNRLHSWRTLLLPFLGEADLYEQIDLSQPWDSPGNQRHAARPLAIYYCPESVDSGVSYMVIFGEDTLFPGQESVPMHDVLDGTSNTLAVAEVHGSTASWMAPVDLSREELPLHVNAGDHGIGSHHPAGALVLMADGTVRFLSTLVSSETLDALITRAGGEVVGQF